jgi:hypothetical protein
MLLYYDRIEYQNWTSKVKLDLHKIVFDMFGKTVWYKQNTIFKQLDTRLKVQN